VFIAAAGGRQGVGVKQIVIVFVVVVVLPSLC
jgi:hypothetical protein